MSIKEYLEINKFELEVEWQKQPTLFQIHADLASDAAKNYDNCKKELDLIEAKLTLAIRKNPSEYGFEGKPSEGAVASAVIVHQEYKDAIDRFIEAKYQRALMDDVVKAFEHKKSALENLVRLYLAGYYSKPNVPQQEKEVVEEVNVAKQLDMLNKGEGDIIRRRRIS